MKYNLTEPFFLKGGAVEMDSIKKWKDKSYLKRKFNNPTVQVEQYKSSEDMQMSKSSKVDMKFDDYLDDLHSGQYLADYQLLSKDVHEDIYRDLVNPRLFGPFTETPVACMLYIGKDTKTGCHVHIGGTRNSYDFALHQIVGKKIVHLFPFEELTLESLFNKRLNFSKENAFQLDKSKYNGYTVELEPGDVLYIPPWTWHACENVGYSVMATKIFERNSDFQKLKKFKKYKNRKRLKSLARLLKISSYSIHKFGKILYSCQNFFNKIIK